MKYVVGCLVDYDEYGLDCKMCGVCSIVDFCGFVEDMGYKVFVVEGFLIVLKIIVSGYVDVVVGVVCLNVFEKVIDKIFFVGIFCMVVLLFLSDCCNMLVDEDWVDDMICVFYVEVKE